MIVEIDIANDSWVTGFCNLPFAIAAWACAVNRYLSLWFVML